MYLFILRLLGIMILALTFNVSLAQPSNTHYILTDHPYTQDINTMFPPSNGRQQAISKNLSPKNPVEEREKKEDKIPPNYFAITPYMPSYILPYYFTGSPYNSAYTNNTPYGEHLDHQEVKYQLSIKVPAWKNIFNHRVSLYLAYTQLSYWQLYNQHAFFRETDYQPELFFANELNYHLGKKWHFDFFNVGAVHQSNGFGNSLERTWNRVYLEAIFARDNWMISIKPWYILTNGGYHKDNPDMAAFLGYGRLLIAYKIKGHVISLVTHNLIEGHARSATGELTWSFPITPYIKGYVQVFSGYGQSLIEYNHRTNSAGIGIALNDWI